MTTNTLRTLKLSLTALLCILGTTMFGQLLEENRHAQGMNTPTVDAAPNATLTNFTHRGGGNQNTPQAMWDQQFVYDVSDSVISAGNTGAFYTGSEFWMSRWASDTLYRLTPTGSMISKFTITGISGTRTFAWDGSSIYLCNASATMYRVNPSTQTVTGTITMPTGVTARFGAYDPTAINNTGGFWVGNFNTDITLVTPLGTTAATITQATHGLGGMYGAVVDTFSQGGPYLWVFHQSGGPSQASISQLKLPAGTPTGVVRDVNADLMTTGGLAGGIFVTNSLVPGENTLGGVLQGSGVSDKLFGYELDFVPASDDASLTSLEGLEYTQTPQNHTTPLTFTGTAQNLGQSALNSMQVKLVVTNNSAVVFSDSAAFSNVPSFGTNNFSLGSYTPTALGNYNVIAWTEILGTQTDQDATNDTINYSFAVTDSTFARDDNLHDGSGGYAVSGTDWAYAMAVYELQNPDLITSVTIGIANPIHGDTTYALVASIAAGTPGSILAQGPPVIIDSNINFYTLPLPAGGVNVPAGQVLVGCYEGAGTTINLAQSNNIFTPGVNFFYTGGGGWFGSGIQTARFIRPNLNNACAGAAFNINSTVTDAICTASNGAVSIAVIGPNLTYSWSNGATTASITGLAAGTYTLTVTDANGCDTTATYTVGTTNNPPSISVSHTDATCGGSDGTATVAPTGGTAPYTYSWNTSPAQTGATATGLAVGTYVCNITDANGCQATGTATIGNAGGPSITVASSMNVSCNGGSNGSATVTATGGVAPYTYSWTTNPVQTTATASNLPAGTYTVTVSDVNSCSGTQMITVTEPNALAGTASAGTINCNGQTTTVTLGVTGGVPPYSYAWSGGSTGASLPGVGAGTYSCTVTDANGCVYNVPAVSITEPTAITSSTTQSNVSCNGGTNGSVSLTISGGMPNYSYLWNNGATSQNLVAVGAGSYTCSITDASGCTHTTQTATITEPAALVITTNSTPDNGTTNGAAIANPTGGTSPYSYNWATSPAQTTQTASGLAAGTYAVTITDANNCTETVTVTVNSNVSIEDLLGAGINVLEAYPNPSTGIFMLDIELMNIDDITLDVYNINGKRIYNTISEHVSSLTQRIDLSNEASGVYMIKVATSQGVAYKRIILE